MRSTAFRCVKADRHGPRPLAAPVGAAPTSLVRLQRLLAVAVGAVAVWTVSPRASAMTFTGAAPVALIYTAATLADDNAPAPTDAALAGVPAAEVPPLKSGRPQATGGRGLLMELPPEVTPGMPAGRPRYLLGFRSEGMKGFMKDIGIGARQCYAPMVRANTKVSSDGLRGTLWLYARCSFD